MPRQHAEEAFLAGQLHLVDVLMDDRALRRDELESQVARNRHGPV
jgi:hypothetical protein